MLSLELGALPSGSAIFRRRCGSTTPSSRRAQPATSAGTRDATARRVLLELGPSGEARAWNDYDQLISEEPGDADARTGRALLALRTGRPAIADVGLTNLLAEPADDTRRAEWLAARCVWRVCRWGERPMPRPTPTLRYSSPRHQVDYAFAFVSPSRRGELRIWPGSTPKTSKVFPWAVVHSQAIWTRSPPRSADPSTRGTSQTRTKRNSRRK